MDGDHVGVVLGQDQAQGRILGRALDERLAGVAAVRPDEHLQGGDIAADLGGDHLAGPAREDEPFGAPFDAGSDVDFRELACDELAGACRDRVRGVARPRRVDFQTLGLNGAGGQGRNGGEQQDPPHWARPCLRRSAKKVAISA